MATILIVEDESSLRSALLSVLGSFGHRAVGVGDGETGIDRAREVQPSLVILDIMLPGISGWEVARRLREDPVTAGIPVIGMSALCGPEHVAMAHALGFVRYLVKPMRLREILDAVSSALADAAPAAAAP